MPCPEGFEKVSVRPRHFHVDYRTTFAFVFPGYLTMTVGAKEGTGCSITDNIGDRLLQNGRAEIYLDR